MLKLLNAFVNKKRKGLKGHGTEFTVMPEIYSNTIGFYSHSIAQ